MHHIYIHFSKQILAKSFEFAEILISKYLVFNVVFIYLECQNCLHYNFWFNFLNHVVSPTTLAFQEVSYDVFSKHCLLNSFYIYSKGIKLTTIFLVRDNVTFQRPCNTIR